MPFEEIKFMPPELAWKKLAAYKDAYYDSMAAMYSGDHAELRRTAESKTFWKRSKCNCRVHVPIASDIASVSANLMFSSEPTYVIVNKDDTEDAEGKAQKRLEEILAENGIANKLNEAAESCAALGDIYFKIRWSQDGTYPLIDMVQPDCAYPEYFFGELRCVHFFSEIANDFEHDCVLRAYERYEKGRIVMALYQGNSTGLGVRLPDAKLIEIGYEPEIITPVPELLAVHIANIRPNRLHRSSMLGRSDLDGIRDLCDSLDETFSSWMRDIRLAKARLIVPAEYMRKRPDSMDEGLAASGMWEFDTDVEAYVALDIDTDRAGGTGIVNSQFAIRASEHEKTCKQLISYIVEMTGYSLFTFGQGAEQAGNASGTSLRQREKKSATTKNKKLKYWQAPIDSILTSLVHLDAVLYPASGSYIGNDVSVAFADSMGADGSTIAETLQMLANASAASTLTKVRMLHPDWEEARIAEEVEQIQLEQGLSIRQPDILLGDFEGKEEEEQEEANVEDGNGLTENEVEQENTEEQERQKRTGADV